ncbi:hypothetical protein Q5P01_020767 [Channa striata]|uniref:Uncharacterized protein n=1 Tax=Channa striata TaxID=64152 RepID=A0AA88S2J7_CHASR|nr:hypothetical protein Q5P01_020767 [Channa striata]
MATLAVQPQSCASGEVPGITTAALCASGLIRARTGVRTAQLSRATSEDMGWATGIKEAWQHFMANSKVQSSWI